MSGTATETPDTESGSEDHETVTAELEVLREENDRLREEYVRARQSQYRRTALMLVTIGFGAVLAGVFFPNTRTVLLALGGTGAFLGVLTYYVTPEQFLPASVGRDIYSSIARNEAGLVSELGLQDERIYVPRSAGTDNVRLFVPQSVEYELPDGEVLADILVVTDRDRERGVSLRPTGSALVEQFERALGDDLDGRATVLADQLTDALVEQFELAETATAETDTETGRMTVAVDSSSYGPLEQFDHPIPSFLAVGLAKGLDEPISLSIDTTDEDDRATYLVTCRWDIPE